MRKKWLINDVPDGPGDHRVHRPRTVAALVAALAAALLAAAAAGCGGGSSESSTSTSASVSTTSTATSSRTTSSSTSTSGGATVKVPGKGVPTIEGAVQVVLLHPSNACNGAVATQHFLHAAYGGHTGCVQAALSQSAAKSLRSYQSRVSGDMATVTVRPVGGVYDGEKITVSLVRDQLGWKVDSLKSNAPVGP